jgi:hypothetical protein
MQVYRAANIEEAIETAYRLRDQGKYDWFRGQVQAWPPMSSLHRLYVRDDPGGAELLAERIELFYRWASKTPELRYLTEDTHVNEFCAVLQHYGVPTNYIDFTTDPGVAGYFAADASTPPTTPCESVIYCLKAEDLRGFWDVMKTVPGREGAAVEPIVVDVQNLWRLQAQSGVFIYAAYNWDIDYPLDRILFPYSGYPAYPSREQIYPEHKSALEQQLDQFFFIERGAQGRKAMLGMKEALEAQGQKPAWIEYDDASTHYVVEAFTSAVEMHPSWHPDELLPWHQVPDEQFDESIGASKKLRLRPELGPEEVGRAVAFGVRQALRADGDLRRLSVDWEITDGPASLDTSLLREALRQVWNGMRRLPFEGEDVAAAFANTCRLFMHEERLSSSLDGALQAAGHALSAPIYVEFAADDYSYSRGYASRGALRGAMRPDLPQLLEPEYRDRASDPEQVLLMMYDPRLLFDFAAFRRLFASDVIPTQVAIRRSLTLFNPARLSTFGLP